MRWGAKGVQQNSLRMSGRSIQKECKNWTYAQEAAEII